MYTTPLLQTILPKKVRLEDEGSFNVLALKLASTLGDMDPETVRS